MQFRNNVHNWIDCDKGAMIEKIGVECSLEQLAEESAELAQAALKLARVLRGTNPTSMSIDRAYEDLIEEFTDVEWCAEQLCLYPDFHLMEFKMERFLNRITDKEKTKVCDIHE